MAFKLTDISFTLRPMARRTSRCKESVGYRQINLYETSKRKIKEISLTSPGSSGASSSVNDGIFNVSSFLIDLVMVCDLQVWNRQWLSVFFPRPQRSPGTFPEEFL